MAAARAGTLRSVAVLVGASAFYGLCAGFVHSPLFAARNLIKFPLLIVVTTAVCALGYHLVARFFGAALRFGEVQRMVLHMFRDTAVLLAALGPVTCLLAWTFQRPDQHDLGEYPMMLGVNVAFIAVCGSLAVVRQARALLKGLSLSMRRSVLVLVSWLALSLLVGGQWAWYLRPFYGIASINGYKTPFCLGTRPDARGATSFYEAVYHLAVPPQLVEGYHIRALRW